MNSDSSKSQVPSGQGLRSFLKLIKIYTKSYVKESMIKGVLQTPIVKY